MRTSKDFFLKIKKILDEEGWLGVLKRIFKRALKPFRFILLPYALVKIRGLKKKPKERLLHDILDDSFFNLIFAMQIYQEIDQLLDIIQKKNPKAILEIGTANGGSLFLFCQFSPSNAKIISIDLPMGRFGRGYPSWKIPLYKSFTESEQELFLLREDSHKTRTGEKIEKILGNKKIDFLFIDGDHAYEGVKKDFEMYSPLVQNGGIIALHDIVPGSDEHVGGVPQFWQEIKNKYNSVEIVEDWKQGGYGIGIIYN